MACLILIDYLISAILALIMGPRKRYQCSASIVVADTRRILVISINWSDIQWFRFAVSPLITNFHLMECCMYTKPVGSTCYCF